MSTLRLRLCPLAELGADSALEFEVLDEGRAVLERGRAVPAALPRLRRIELVVAAPDVLLLEAAVPPLSGARLRAALHALAEPHLLSDPGAVYVAAERHAGSSRATLAVLDRVLLERALELLRRLKLVPERATPEQLTLPLSEGCWRLRLGPAYGCLRTGALRGIACAPATGGEPPLELRLALEQAGAAKPREIEVEGSCDAQAWSAALGVPVRCVEATGGRAAPLRLELLQYELAPRVLDWRAWRLPAALAAACALTWIAGLNVDAWLMAREERALRERMDAAVREALPRVPVVLDPLKQMRRAVTDLRTGAGEAEAHDFLPLAAGLARALPADADVVRSLEFRDRVLRVELEPRALEAPGKRELVLRELAAAGLAGAFAGNTLTLRGRGSAP